MEQQSYLQCNITEVQNRSLYVHVCAIVSILRTEMDKYNQV